MLNLLLFPIVFAAIRRPRDLEWVMVLFVLGGLSSAVIGWLDLFGGGGDPDAEGRLAGVGINANELGGLLVCGTVFAAALGASRERAIPMRAMWFAAAGLSGLALALTLSRGAIVGMLVAFLVAPLLAGPRRRLPTIAMSLLAAATIAMSIIALVPETAVSRLTSSDHTGSGRTDIWRIALRMVDDRPVLGVGAGNFQDASIRYVLLPGVLKRDEQIVNKPKVTHNVYLQVLAELGAVGLALFLAVIVSSLLATLRAARIYSRAGLRSNELMARALLVGLIGFLAAEFFSSQLYSKQLWLLLALGPAVLATARTAAKQAAARRAPRRRHLHPVRGGDLRRRVRLGRGRRAPDRPAGPRARRRAGCGRRTSCTRSSSPSATPHNPTLIVRPEPREPRHRARGGLARDGARRRVRVRVPHRARLDRLRRGVDKLRGRRLLFAAANDSDFTLSSLGGHPTRASLYRFGAAAADAMVVQSTQQVELANGLFPHHSVTEIPSFVEPAPPSAAPADAFLWAARLVDYKRPLAFLDLAEAVPEARFWMIGVSNPGDTTPELEAEVRRRAASLDNVELFGRLRHTEVMELVERSAAIVNTAITEGMPNVFLEGWTRGIPALTLEFDPDGRIERQGLGISARGSWEDFVAAARDLWARREDRGGYGPAVRAYVDATARARGGRRRLGARDRRAAVITPTCTTDRREALLGDWARLHSAEATPFMSAEWAGAWFEHYDGDAAARLRPRRRAS